MFQDSWHSHPLLPYQINYYGILKHEVNLVEEKNKLEWVTINEKLLDNSKFAGNYNIPHIIRQIKVYLENGTEIDKY